MLRHARERASHLVAIVATGLIVAGPLLPAGPAAAAPPRIEFSRHGLGLLTCTSTPSDDEVTVQAESTVIFENDLREDATLRIDGRDAARVPDDGTAEVLFHRGTVRVEMVPDCGLSLSRDFDAVSVNVVGETGNSRPSSSTPAKSRAPGSSATAKSPESRATDRRKTDRGEDSPSPDGNASSSTAPAGEGASPSEDSAEGAAAGDDQAVAAEPVYADATSGDNGPNSLLAIIAIVCVVGVSAGAIRAIFAQRASGARVT